MQFEGSTSGRKLDNDGGELAPRQPL